jgi:hypothetical protein
MPSCNSAISSTAVAALLPLERSLRALRARTGGRAKDRAALATAFLAKAIVNLPTTRDLIGRLKSRCRAPPGV